MPGIDRGPGRLVALVALMVLAGVALRGYMPGQRRAPREHPTDNPASMFAVLALLAVALVIVALAVIAWLRDPSRAGPGPHQLPAGADRREPTRWRALLIGLGALLAWLLVVMLLLQFAGPHRANPAGAPPAGGAGPAPPRAAPPPTPPRHSGGDLFGYLAATTVIMLVLLVTAATLIAIRRRRAGGNRYPARGDRATPTPAAPGPESLALAAERGLAEMEDPSRDPREAIIACYAAMERALADAPGAMPLDSDTPSEVLERAVEHHALHPGTATGLVDLFAEARFSTHVMNEGHREAAVRALQLVLAELRSLI